MWPFKHKRALPQSLEQVQEVLELMALTGTIARSEERRKAAEELAVVVRSYETRLAIAGVVPHASR